MGAGIFAQSLWEAGAWLESSATLKSSQERSACAAAGMFGTELALPVLLKRPQRPWGALESVEQLSAALEEGTGLVKEVFHGYARTMAIHVGNLINICDPRSNYGRRNCPFR